MWEDARRDHLMTRSVIALVVTLAVAGCSGGREQEQVFTAADAKRLANVRPVTPGWGPWPRTPEKPRRSTTSREERAAEDPVYAAYRQRVAGIAEGPEEGTRWSDDDKLGNLAVSVLETPADAKLVFAALNDLSRGYAEQYGFVTKAGKSTASETRPGSCWSRAMAGEPRSTGAGQTSSSRHTSTATAPAHGTSSRAHGPGRRRSMRRREAASSCRQVAGRSGAHVRECPLSRTQARNRSSRSNVSVQPASCRACRASVANVP